jgi:hypothetical protein
MSTINVNGLGAVSGIYNNASYVINGAFIVITWHEDADGNPVDLNTYNYDEASQPKKIEKIIPASGVSAITVE